MTYPVRGSSSMQGGRINQTAFVAAQFTFLGLAILAASCKIGYRLRTKKSLSADDLMLILSVVFLTAVVVLFYFTLDLVYTLFGPRSTFDARRMLTFTRLINSSAVLSWATIFTVKISFVWFFRHLVDRLPRMKAWWTAVFATVVACAPVNMFITFFICSDFTLGLQSCAPHIVFRTAVYLNVTAALDIFTDVLVLSVPVALLWRVKINLRRKLALGAVLCLSTFMVVIAIIRLSLAYIPQSPDGEGPGLPASQLTPDYGGSPDRQLDQSWMFFWLNMEAAVAIIMVASTAFKSMLGRQANSHDEYTPPAVARPPSGKSRSTNSGSKSRSATSGLYDLGEWDEEERIGGYVELKDNRSGKGGKHDREWYRSGVDGERI